MRPGSRPLHRAWKFPAALFGLGADWQAPTRLRSSAQLTTLIKVYSAKPGGYTSLILATIGPWANRSRLRCLCSDRIERKDYEV